MQSAAKLDGIMNVAEWIKPPLGMAFVVPIVHFPAEFLRR